eukprot:tig00021373_g21080.t1
MLVMVSVQFALTVYKKQISAATGIPPHQLVSYHMTLGKVLAGFAVLLILEKFYIVARGLKFRKIPNALVAASIKNHFIGFGGLVIAQYVTATNGDLVASTLGVPVDKVYKAHEYMGYAVAAFTVVLTLEKLYLSTLPKTAKPGKSE